MGNIVLLSSLVNMDEPKKVFAEIEFLLSSISPTFPIEKITKVLEDLISLYKGEYPPYKACTRKFHDLKHSTDVSLATTRLIHAAHLDGRRFTNAQLFSTIITSFFHDVGYIPKASEEFGTGIKLSLKIPNLSFDFINQYLKKNNNFNLLTADDLLNIKFMLQATAFNFDATKVKFPSLEVELLAKIIGTADLLGQMADRTYIEKLLHLFDEQFQEQLIEDDEEDNNSSTPTPINELELMKQTSQFHDNLKENFGKNFSGVNKLMKLHFKDRWNIDDDLYDVAIANNINYLKEIINKYGQDFKKHLHRH
ncbi:MAG: hypothetical protein A2504_15485 [Bdellovibrionales bacterium RIFOXYD12_FULL_39_22]|nr:MAG: hypothetical protein A2385_02915 [Bdellovibrionales bacterium RIFOXYB1_FULL_39_21]OFZ43196.1 MAG: hypothetical protein A2485_12060 [Bdellovibrionales bacterium RIFOXYC12_FULL_39_17]OFZ47934.1 MAG: hypothetical protein A2404_16700 [Bdellovibrionales bacterium RIFOXYC1_FULL_39_130]OFZ74852.1 MAG: hypothetical protein A2451_03240 [Bdellovibrionales bacterium RIFOXYC2_FULL_39_8]OFZ75714.1 MAG: hypothetical protein A2560_13200 [Bdellovibrionales bacterium RIFOXYD1_FULL_39_84]OFZ94204.1 MAG: